MEPARAVSTAQSRQHQTLKFIMEADDFRRLSALLNIDSVTRGAVPDPGNITLERWNELWREVVGPSIAERTTILPFSSGQLRVYADTPTWAHAVNQRRISIRKTLVERGLPVTDIAVLVTPARPQAKREPIPSPAALSKETGGLLRQMANQVSDPALGAALRRLSRHAR